MFVARQQRKDPFAGLFRRGWIVQEALAYEIAELEWLCLLGRPREERARQDRRIAKLATEHQAILSELKVLTARIRGRN